VIFADRNKSGIDKHGMTSNQVQTTFNSAVGAGLKTGGIAGYDGSSRHHRFIGFWRK
jgi:hypothetical protein